MLLLAILLADVAVAGVPTGVNSETTLGDLGAAIFVIGLLVALVIGALTMYFRVVKLVRGAVEEMLDSRAGKRILANALWGDNKQFEDAVWSFLKGQDFVKWQKSQVEDVVERQLEEMSGKLDELARLMTVLTAKFDEMARVQQTQAIALAVQKSNKHDPPASE